MSQDIAGADQSQSNHMHTIVVDSFAIYHVTSVEGTSLLQEIMSYCLRQKLLYFVT